jgi:hypothetical protein
MQIIGSKPDSRPARDAFGFHTELREDSDHHTLEAPHVRDDVDGIGQPHDGISDELARTVPGDFATAIDVDDRRAIRRPFDVLGAFACRIYGRVLEEKDCVWRPPCYYISVYFPLKVQSVEIRHGVGA